MVNLAMAIVITVVCMGILIVDVRLYSKLRQEVDELWRLNHELSEIIHTCDGELKYMAARLTHLETKEEDDSK